jgi:hypothetical protein
MNITTDGYASCIQSHFRKIPVYGKQTVGYSLDFKKVLEGTVFNQKHKILQQKLTRYISNRNAGTTEDIS